eukprot:snap_masked-scaffold_39-processed-gene-2.61-mRNA-1 protein AED:1.00 eAED:1.00 QI:0/-1/0/0/-1/1/1/0/113
MEDTKKFQQRLNMLQKDVIDISKILENIWKDNEKKTKTLILKETTLVGDLNEVIDAAVENSENVMNATLNISLALDTEKIENLQKSVSKIEDQLSAFEETAKELIYNSNKRTK